MNLRTVVMLADLGAAWTLAGFMWFVWKPRVQRRYLIQDAERRLGGSNGLVEDGEGEPDDEETWWADYEEGDDV